MKRYMAHLRRGAEIRTQNFLDTQVQGENQPGRGGLPGQILEAKPTIYVLAPAVAVWLDPESRFYQSGILYQAISQALDFAARLQREDGSFDYPSCNFKSAADTSFCFKRLFGAWRLLKQYEDRIGEPDQGQLLREKYLGLMRRALEAICQGGFHTPNHRWGIAAALLQGANLFREEEAFAQGLRGRAAQYLAEGIDGDEDGEYAERSTGNYNAVVNNAMIAMYEETGEERFLGYVRRNLSMMLTYMDPDDTIFTQNSTRQDQGKQEYGDKYFYQYLYLCAREDAPAFDAAAHKIIRDNQDRGDLAPDCYHIVMAHREMAEHTFQGYGYPEQYRRYYPHSQVLRVKKQAYTYTVLNQKSAFLYLKQGSTMIYVKIGESLCDIRNFIPRDITVEEGSVTLQATAESWYYLPLKEPPSTSDWWKMDQSKRERLISSTLTVTVLIRELPDGLELTIDGQGLDRLPLRLEICVPAGAVLSHPSFWTTAAPGGSLILRSGVLQVQDGRQSAAIGPGFGEHEFQGHYSGEELNTAGFTVYCNAYTPCRKTIRLQFQHR